MYNLYIFNIKELIMKLFKQTLASILIFSTIASAATFEQNGVKEGNNKISIGLYSIIPDEGDESITLYGQAGHFFSDDIEGLLDIMTTTRDGETSYYLAPGVNYYFAKTPVLTPYVGTQIYHFGDTGSDVTSYGGRVYGGANYFLNENAAITPEAGAEFFELEEYLQSYVKVYLSYFFN